MLGTTCLLLQTSIMPPTKVIHKTTPSKAKHHTPKKKNAKENRVACAPAALFGSLPAAFGNAAANAVLNTPPPEKPPRALPEAAARTAEREPIWARKPELAAIWNSVLAQGNRLANGVGELANGVGELAFGVGEAFPGRKARPDAQGRTSQPDPQPPARTEKPSTAGDSARSLRPRLSAAEAAAKAGPWGKAEATLEVIGVCPTPRCARAAPLTAAVRSAAHESRRPCVADETMRSGLIWTFAGELELELTGDGKTVRHAATET